MNSIAVATSGFRRTRARAAFRPLAVGAIVFLAYVVAAKVGFQFAFVAEQVTTVWAPTGIAIASLLLCGTRLWPAIWLGAFVVNAQTTAPLWTAVFVASGNTLEAIAAATLLRRTRSIDFGFTQISDVLRFVLAAVIACTAISATVGSTTLCAAGVQPWSRFGALWFDWWLGDALGALIVAPPILTIAAHGRVGTRDAMRFCLFVAGCAIVTHVTFEPLVGLGARPLEFVVFPLMIAAAVAGGPPLTSTVVLACSAINIWHRVGFDAASPAAEVHHQLVLLQTFTAVLATTALLLSAAIAERQRLEVRHRESADTLRRREQLLRLAQRAGGIATFEWDFQNQLARCSPEFFEIFGLQGREGEINGSEWAEFVHPDDRERMGTHLARALDGSEPAATDYRIVRADGAERWLSYTGHIEHLPEGARMVGTVLDVTDRKRMEAELRQRASELERNEAALRAAKDSAEAANRLKDQFLATLSHELRTPLNAILGYARMLQTDTIPAEKRGRAIDVIARNAVAQNQLIEDLLDVSRITRGQLRLEPTPVPIAAVLRDAVEVLRPAADGKRIRLDVNIDPFAGIVNADAARLQQVFWNLLTNAVKFTDAGGTVTATLRRATGEVEVTVSDTGAGIPADFLPFVFEPFRQADAALAPTHGGLGLGLAISKQLVELHGGTIRAASEGPGRGATFVVKLPAHDDVRATRSLMSSSRG